MNSINFLKSKIEEVSQFIDLDEKKLAEDSSNFSLSLELSSMKQHKEHLQTELRKELEFRNKEVFELRLISSLVNSGSIPLRLLGDICDPIHKAFNHAAFFVRNKVNSVNKLPFDLVYENDLRLSGIQHGSCRLQITGNVSTDLAGDNQLSDAYYSIFKILESESDGGKISFKEVAPTIGTTAVKHLDRLFETLEKEGVAAEFTWDSPDGKFYRWGGSLEDVRLARLKLNRVSTSEPVSVEISGMVVKLAKSGSIQVEEIETKQKVVVLFGKDLIKKVNTLTLNTYVKLEVDKITSLDEVTGVEKNQFHLLDVKN
jgi:hypothetical protein